MAFLILRLEFREAAAVIVMGSQKTLTVSLAILTFLPSSVGNSGLLMIGVMLPWLGQTFFLIGMMNIISKFASPIASESRSSYVALPNMLSDAIVIESDNALPGDILSQSDILESKVGQT